MSKNLKGNLMLVMAAFLWGISFVMQDRAAIYLSPFAINGIRSIVGTLSLLPLILLRSRKSGVKVLESSGEKRKALLISGILCGIFLCVATNFQQFGIELYPEEAAASGRAGFITALYVVLVPIFNLFNKKSPSFTVWIAVVFAAVGMFLLCLGGSERGIYTGDLVVLCCTVAFTLQILCIDRYSDSVDGVKLSAFQFLVCGILSLILMFIFDTPTIENVIAAAPYILYLGIMSCGAAYTLQIIGQQYSRNPTVASILMSLESVFAALAGVVLIGESFTLRETFGCVIMFAAIVFSQLPAPKLHKKA